MAAVVTGGAPGLASGAVAVIMPAMNDGRQQGLPQQRLLVEEKYYDIRYEEGAPLIKQALEHALGVRLQELAPGMWSGTREEPHGWGWLDVTVRALRVDGGTSVEVQMENRYNTKAAVLGTIGIIAGCVILLPLIPVIWKASTLTRQERRQRLIDMHRAWVEIGEAIGSPRRASYREQPRRAYAPRRIAEPLEEQPPEPEISEEPLAGHAGS